MKILNSYTKRAVQNKINPFLAKINVGLSKPTSIHFSITQKCTLSCKHCDIWKNGKSIRKELNTEEIKNIISNLRSWLGPYHINFAGGEPFVRKDIIDIIEFCSNNKINTSVTTNATMIDKNMAKKILDSGLDVINISLDSLKPEFHDYTRDKKGTFNKVMDAIEHLNTDDRKMCIVIATVLMKQNCQEIEDMLRFIEQKKLNGMILQPLFHNFGTDYGTGWYEKNQFWPDKPEIIEKALNTLIDIKKKGGSPLINPIKQLELLKTYFKNPNHKTNLKCTVGLKNLCINEYGEALLCFWLPVVGNLLKENPQGIWKSIESKRRRIQINKCQRNCKLLNCHFD